MKKNFIEKEIESKVNEDVTFEDVVNRIDVESKVKGKKIFPNLKFVMPSLAALVIIVVSISFIFGDGKNNSSSLNPSINNSMYQEPGQKDEPDIAPGSKSENEEDINGTLESSLPHVFQLNGITYNLHLRYQDEVKESTLIGHIIKESELEEYKKEYPSLIPVIDNYAYGTIEIYTIEGLEQEEYLLVKASGTKYIYSSK